jgi:hypothetical protein
MKRNGYIPWNRHVLYTNHDYMIGNRKEDLILFLVVIVNLLVWAATRQWWNADEQTVIMNVKGAKSLLCSFLFSCWRKSKTFFVFQSDKTWRCNRFHSNGILDEQLLSKSCKCQFASLRVLSLFYQINKHCEQYLQCLQSNESVTYVEKTLIELITTNRKNNLSHVYNKVVNWWNNYYPRKW